MARGVVKALRAGLGHANITNRRLVASNQASIRDIVSFIMRQVFLANALKFASGEWCVLLE